MGRIAGPRWLRCWERWAGFPFPRTSWSQRRKRLHAAGSSSGRSFAQHCGRERSFMSGPEPVQPEVVYEETRRWLRFAQEDLNGARSMLADSSAPPRLACVLAQQAAEKAIKAGLIFLQREFPYRHDLVVLRDLLPPDWEIATGYEYLDSLSAWVIQGR